jgi:hypothetical protein
MPVRSLPPTSLEAYAVHQEHRKREGEHKQNPKEGQASGDREDAHDAYDEHGTRSSGSPTSCAASSPSDVERELAAHADLLRGLAWGEAASVTQRGVWGYMSLRS